MIITHLNLPVTSIEKSFHFYQEYLDAKMVNSFHNTDGHTYKYILNAHGFDLFLEESDPQGLPSAFHFGIQLSKEQLFKKYNEVKNISEIIHYPLKENPPNSNTYRFYIKDPDGTIVEFYDKI